MPPKVESAIIRYQDGSFVTIRSNDDGSYAYHYWGERESDGSRDLIAKNPRNAGVWAALMAVAAMADLES